jgi:AcrR family transcriptional regulator
VPRRADQHPPRQARSRETRRRLLDAAETVLEQHGWERATLPRIAAEAGVAPASVYRRFRDKDALMRAVFNRFSDLNAEELKRQMNTEPVRRLGIRAFAHQWVGALITGYRTRTGLVRAAVMYSRQHADAAFVRRKERLETESFRRMVQLFLLWRDEIRHPDPEYAVSYGMLMVAFALRELILFDQARMFGKLVPVGDDRLRKELPRVFLRYIGVDDSARAPKSGNRR